MLTKKTYRIRLWYKRLNEEEKRIAKSIYTRTFKVAERMFYHAMSNDDLSARQLEFFSRLSGLPMEDFITEPLKLRKLSEEVEFSKQELAQKLGLSL